MNNIKKQENYTSLLCKDSTDKEVKEVEDSTLNHLNTKEKINAITELHDLSNKTPESSEEYNCTTSNLDFNLKSEQTCVQSIEKKLCHKSLSNELLPSLLALNLTTTCTNKHCLCYKTNKRHIDLDQQEAPVTKVSRNKSKSLTNSIKTSTFSSFDNSKLQNYSDLPKFASYLPKDFNFCKLSPQVTPFSAEGSKARSSTSSSTLTPRISSENDHESIINKDNQLSNSSDSQVVSGNSLIDLSDIKQALPIFPMQSCSQQALTTEPMDDITMAELSAYFDNYCHIPKNMSEMAKRMYT